MKKYILIVLGIALTVPAMAQQIPLYSQYYMNPFLYNPALTGHEGDLKASGIYRRQWTDVNGAPETRTLALEGALSKKRVGLGGYVYQDFTGIMERLGGYLSYAYYIQLSKTKDMRLGLGLAGGVQQTRVDFGRASTGNEEFDPVVVNNNGSGVAFDGSAGISFIFEGLKVGFAVPQVVETEIKHLNNDAPLNYTLSRHYLATASYNIGLAKDKFFIEPLAMFRYAQGGQWQIDAGSRFSYKEIVWLSAMYRYDYAVTIGGGFKVHDRLSVGYAYDLSVNNLNGVAGGTHEAFIGIRFGGEKRDEGLIEEIKQLKRMDSIQNSRIDTISTKQTKIISQQDSLSSQNSELKKTIEEKDAQIEKLEQQVKDILNNISNMDKAESGTRKGNIPSSDLVVKGSKDDLEFITGQPDNNYFMVVSSVRTEAKAREIASGLKDEGYDVGVVFNKRRTWHYIFLEKPGTLEEGLKDLYKLRKESEFKDAWIHIYE